MDAPRSIDRRAHAHRQSTDRRMPATLPRLVDAQAAVDAAAQAMAIGEAIATERARLAAEYAARGR
jgi:hypothetical protein